MHELVVRMEIPIPSEPVVGVPALIFSRWLPLGDDHEIVLHPEGMEVKLSFGLESTWWATRISEEEIQKTTNVPAHRMYAVVVVHDLDQELVTYIQHRDHLEPASSDEASLQERYDELAWRVLSEVLSAVNRMLSYAKSRWGQYWLSQYELDRGNMHGRLMGFNAEASVDGGEWVTFAPSAVLSLTARQVDQSRFITRDQWEEVRHFVLSSGQPPLTRALLAGAELLAATGYTRSALTEAVTALEVAIFRFARTPQIEETLGPKVTARVDVESLAAQVERLGLSGTVRYLLPLLLPEESLPVEVLEGCREAILQRQNVVHQGQRAVRESTLKRSLSAIRKMCDVLESLSIQTARNDGDG